MKTISLLAALLFVPLCPGLTAADSSSYSFIRTNSGKVYTNCRIFKRDPDGVIINHANGAAKLLFAELPEDVRSTLGYDAEKEAAYEKSRAEAKARQQEQLMNYRRELAQAAAIAGSRQMEAIAMQSISTPYSYGYGAGWWDPGYGWSYPNAFGYGYGQPFSNHWGAANCYSGRFQWPYTIGVTTLPSTQGRVHHGYGYAHQGQHGRHYPVNRDCARPVLNVHGRTIAPFGAACAPRPSVAATPAMGRSTPAMGRPAPALRVGK